jgi:hypothetical protein
MSLAGIHVFIRIIGNRNNAGLPRKRVATPKARSCPRVGWTACPVQNLFHSVCSKSFRKMRCFQGFENVRVVGRTLCGDGDVLLCRQSKGENHRCFWKLFLRRHILLYIRSLTESQTRFLRTTNAAIQPRHNRLQHTPTALSTPFTYRCRSTSTGIVTV